MSDGLLIDIGNSRVKWAWAKPGRIESGEAFNTVNVPLAFPGAWEDAPPPSQVWVANVAGTGIAQALETWTKRHWDIAPRFVCSEAQSHGVTNGYDHPEKLGVDRWVALIGARHLYAGPVCVADCGTAITFDALDGEGRHLGGLIAPGFSLMRGSLARGTHALPLSEDSAAEPLARTTVAAIASGTRLAAVGLIERAFRDATQRLGSQPRLLLTGGDAPLIAAALEVPNTLRPDLVLEGLWVMSA